MSLDYGILLKFVAENSSFRFLPSQIQLAAAIIGLLPFACRWVHIRTLCPGRPRRGTPNNYLQITGPIPVYYFCPHNWGFCHPPLSHVASRSDSPSKTWRSHRCILEFHYGAGKSLCGFGGMGRCLIVL